MPQACFLQFIKLSMLTVIGVVCSCGGAGQEQLASLSGSLQCPRADMLSSRPGCPFPSGGSWFAVCLLVFLGRLCRHAHPLLSSRTHPSPLVSGSSWAGRRRAGVSSSWSFVVLRCPVPPHAECLRLADWFHTEYRLCSPQASLEIHRMGGQSGS